MERANDRAGVAFWDSIWQNTTVPVAIDPLSGGIWYARHRRFHSWFESQFAGLDTRGRRLLEIGAARSEWLPYFARTWGFRVTGLDYSLLGAQQCKQVLSSHGLAGDVVCADFRTPPSGAAGTFDVVTSFGVIEHFDDVVQALQSASRWLRPGGLLITEIPNMTGVIGWQQRTWNRPVYDVHVPLGRDELIEAHQSAGLPVQSCEYLVLLPFGVINLQGLADSPLTRTKKALHYWMQGASAMLWWLDERIRLPAPDSRTGGYVICAARKPLNGGQAAD